MYIIMDDYIKIKLTEYNDLIMKLNQLEELTKKYENHLSNIRERWRENTNKYINKDENIEKIREKRREYAKKYYEKNKNNEEFISKMRGKSLKSYHLRKNV